MLSTANQMLLPPLLRDHLLVQLHDGRHGAVGVRIIVIYLAPAFQEHGPDIFIGVAAGSKGGFDILSVGLPALQHIHAPAVIEGHGAVLVHLQRSLYLIPYRLHGLLHIAPRVLPSVILDSAVYH